MKKFKVSIYCVAEYEVEAETSEEALENYDKGKFLGEYVSEDDELHYVEELA